MSIIDCYLEVRLEVEYDFSPAYPGSHMDPPEEPELEITSVILRNIHTLVKTDIQAYLTPKEMSMIENQIIDSMPGPEDYDGEY